MDGHGLLLKNTENSPITKRQTRKSVPDGWVPLEMYDRAVKENQAVKDELLEGETGREAGGTTALAI
jgi:hypothetical protein